MTFSKANQKEAQHYWSFRQVEIKMTGLKSNDTYVPYYCTLHELNLQLLRNNKHFQYMYY